jgi:hypothetical protein
MLVNRLVHEQSLLLVRVTKRPSHTLYNLYESTTSIITSYSATQESASILYYKDGSDV